MDIVPFTVSVAFGALLSASALTSSPQASANEGYRQLWAGDSYGPQGSINLFRGALQADPAFPYRWADLGEALAAADERQAAQYCFRRALELAPESPQIAMRAANFSFSEEDRQSGLRLSGAVLGMTPEYNSMVFNSWTRFGGDVNNLLQEGGRNDVAVAGAFFRFLLNSGRSREPDVTETWTWLEQHSGVTPPLAKTWTDWLIEHHRERDALPVWKRYVTKDPAWGVTNWIDNAGFENAPAGEGFDWRISACPGVSAEFDAEVAHTGNSSLRVNFDGTQNPDFHHVAELVSPPPGRYRLSAWIRTENLSTDQGVGLALNGVATAALTGTNGWTEVSADLIVDADRPAGDVQVVRRKSWRFDNKPHGVAWIDDVSLRRTGGE